MPSRLHVAATRHAISPRLAISILLNMAKPKRGFSHAGYAPVTWSLHMHGSHAEHAETRVLDERIHRRRQPETEHVAGLRRVDHAIVPQARAGVIRMALRFVLVADRRFERLFLFRRPRAALAFDTIATHGSQHRSGLFSTHHGDARIRPHPEETRRIRATAHAVIPGAKRPADDYRELRHLGGGDRRHHLRAIAGDAFVLVLAPDHEAGDVL